MRRRKTRSLPARCRISCWAILLLLVVLFMVSYSKVQLGTYPSITGNKELHQIMTGKQIQSPSKESFQIINRKQIQSPPRKMSATNNSVYFLHIGKAGGTSVDMLMGRTLKNRNYYGHKHYDWSWVEQRGDPDKNADVITFLREPVSRSVSQFRFSKQLKWARKRNATFLHQTFNEYLAHPGSWRQPINDGAAGITFLAGISKGKGWIASDGMETDYKQFLRNNITASAYEAARNLDRTVYFGLLEDIPRSMKMLQLTLNMEQVPNFPKINSSRKKRKRNASHGDISNETASMIKSYIPGDIWLYQYAKLLFEARWDYLTGEAKHYEHPQLPPLPESLQHR